MNKPTVPQALPQDENLTTPASQETEAEKIERLAREAKINKTPPDTNATIGPDTTGVGQPAAQPVNQGQSLPAAAVPVEKKFEGEVDKFYDPSEVERATAEKIIGSSGGKKAV